MLLLYCNFEHQRSLRYNQRSPLSCGPPWKQHHTDTHISAMFVPNLSLKISIFSMIPILTVCCLILEETQLWNDVSIGYLAQNVTMVSSFVRELCSLPTSSLTAALKLRSQYLPIHWNCYWIQQCEDLRNDWNWKEIRVSKQVSCSYNKICSDRSISI